MRSTIPSKHHRSAEAVFSRRASSASRSAQQQAWLALLAAALTVFVAGCQSSSSFQWPSNRASDPRAAIYATNPLQEGDILNISFENSTNFNTLQKIGLDGTVNLESVGHVKAAGKTPQQLEKELLQLYLPQVKQDVITVKVASTSASVYVSGAVNHPGKIPLEHPMTVLEAIMEAGGFDATRAKLSQVTVLRIENGTQRRYHVNAKRMLEGDDDRPFYVQPFDIVHVPTKTFNF